MKKFTRILALCLLMCIVVATFSSCAFFKPSNPDAMADKLEPDFITEMKHENALKEIQKMIGNLHEKGYFSSSQYRIYHGTYYIEIYDNYTDERVFCASVEPNTIYAKAYLKVIKRDWKNMYEFEDAATYGRKGTLVYYGNVKIVKDALGFPANIFVFRKIVRLFI